MNGFLNTYQNIFIALCNPVMGQSIDTPANRQEWKRFFGMMDTLERAEIATFQNGRYVLHPKRKADVVKQAEAVLAGISKPLTMPESDEVPVYEYAPPAPLMPEFNRCPACQGKGRVNIEDELGFFGNLLCVTCYGKKQIPVPSRSSFPPVDLSKKPAFVNALLFSDSSKPVAPIPQALEVSGVRVIVQDAAPVLSMPVVSAEDAAAGLVAIAEKPALVPADCSKCQGSGIVIDNSSGVRLDVRTCPECGGSGDVDDTDYSKYPTREEIQAALAMDDDSTQPLPILDVPEDESAATQWVFENENEILEPAPCLSSIGDCPECCGYGFLNCPRCNGSGYVDTSGNPCSCKPEDYVCFRCGGTGGQQPSTPDSPEDELPIAKTIEPIDAMGDGGFVWHDRLEEAAAEPKQYVRINTTGRGMSSGKYELIREEEKYGRKWMVVKFTTDKGLPHWFPAEICELVNTPKAEAKAIEPIVAAQTNLLEGLPIMQAIAQHGVENTKAALNVVAERVVAQSMNSDFPVLEAAGVQS